MQHMQEWRTQCMSCPLEGVPSGLSLGFFWDPWDSGSEVSLFLMALHVCDPHPVSLGN